MVNLFLRTFGFKGVILHLESIMAVYGSAVAYSCVVDIGSSFTSVCCVDEGILIEESVIRKNYGGDDITKLLHLMLTRPSSPFFFPSHSFDINNPYHFRIFERIKETECELPNIQSPISMFVPKNINIWLHKKYSNTKIINLTISDASTVPYLGYFDTDIIETFKDLSVPKITPYNDIYEEFYKDCEDNFEEMITLLIDSDPKKDEINTTAKKEKKQENENDDSMSMSPSGDDSNSNIYNDDYKSKKNNYNSMLNLEPLEDLICQSIMSVNNPELRKKLANSILLVGGGSKAKGLIDYLEDQLIDKLTTLDPEIDRIEIINFPNIDPKTISWIGGSVLPKLDGVKDMWISRERWIGDLEKANNEDNKDEAGKTEPIKEKKSKKDKQTESGVKLIREKVPFQW